MCITFIIQTICYNKDRRSDDMSLYEIEVENMQGISKPLETYKGKVLLIVNTASKCGFTPQFEGLEELNKEYKEQGLHVLGFPCNQFMHQDPGNNEEILSFCTLQYNVSFEMFKKLDVKGKNIHPLYRYLTTNSPTRTNKNIKWNFEKFLISRDGEIIQRYLPNVKPHELVEDIKMALQK